MEHLIKLCKDMVCFPVLFNKFSKDIDVFDNYMHIKDVLQMIGKTLRKAV